nr:H-NS histone family protein [Aquicoccus sp. G2-2]MEA1114438.1 H-NS histone family protein [Aquicoccus sp. G2-2]
MATLNEMSLSELQSLEKKVAKAIVKFEDREKKKAVAELKAQARKLGYSLDELAELVQKGEAAPGKPRGKVAPKYANPKDPSQKWTGRGRRPAWVVEALEAGKTLDDLTI